MRVRGTAPCHVQAHTHTWTSTWQGLFVHHVWTYLLLRLMPEWVQLGVLLLLLLLRGILMAMSQDQGEAHATPQRLCTPARQEEAVQCSLVEWQPTLKASVCLIPGGHRR